MQAYEISKQLFRASSSIGANVAEGHGRHEGREYIHYLHIAQGSANEVDHWLNLALDCEIGDVQSLRKIIDLNNETRKMLVSTINTLKSNLDIKSLREASIPYSHSPLTPLIED